MSSSKPTVTVCIPHWQVEQYMTCCLRSIRKHSERYDLEVIVVDNGSEDESIDYLRSLDWIHLIERPEETSDNWPLNVFTAWDRGLEVATGEFYVTMHSDVFVKQDDWLDPFFREFNVSPDVAATGAWKLDLEHPLYAFQKRVVGYATARVKSLFGKKKPANWKTRRYPRDYCAMYRTEVLREHGLTFRPVNGCGGGGYSIAKQIWDADFNTGMIPVEELAEKVFHVAHGTAAVTDKQLNHRRAQKKVEQKAADLFEELWILELQHDAALDHSRFAA